MTFYHYAVIERPRSYATSAADLNPNMESVDYKRQPSPKRLREAIDASAGVTCGIFRGGMFGLTTNQIAVLSAWEDFDTVHGCMQKHCQREGVTVAAYKNLQATVRPQTVETLTRAGVYVIRWIEMSSRDVADYTALCLQTWPAFEAKDAARCVGVFRVDDESEPCLLLMLTWYENLTEWEQSRQLVDKDAELWVRRSEMELSHWAQTGRIELD